jgi:hypothetical protein
VSALAAIALGAAACGGGQPAARAFGSTELEPLRDSTIELYGESGLGIVDYTTGSPAVWWTLNLATGAVQSSGATRPSVPQGTPTPTPQPYRCNESYAAGDLNGSYTLEIVDTATNAETDVPGVLSYVSCPGADGMLTAIAFDAGGGLVLESGPIDYLQPAELTVALLAFINWGGYTIGATGPGAPTNMTVLAAPVTAPDQEEIDTIDLATLDVTVDVPSVPASDAWAAGATPAGSLQSTSVAGSASLIQSLDGHYVYPRKMSDGGSAMFAGPFASGPASELALFEVPVGTPLPSTTEVGLAPGTLQLLKRALLTWQLEGAAGAASELFVWDDTDLTATTCPSAAGASLDGIWSPDQSKVLFAVPQGAFGTAGSYGAGGLLDLLTLGTAGGSASCQQLAASEVVTADFSPDGDFVFWLAEPPAGEVQLFAAAGDGSGAHMIGTGEIEDAHFIGDGGARLELTLGGELEWIDLHDAASTLHHVAEQVHGPTYDIVSGPWLIVNYQWSPTDGTGTLAVIDRDNGQVRVISPAVAQYEALPEELGADGGFVDPFGDAGVGDELVVVYVVRGRNPSSQDGLWRATIVPSELQ